MKVKISRADCYGNLIQDYPCLEKYREWFIPKDSKDFWCHYTNCIIKEMNNDELFKLIQELTCYEEIVIGYADKYDHENYGIDVKITIYDDYLE